MPITSKLQTTKKIQTIDGNEAAAQVAYQASEVIAIYPITPSSTMAEWADAWKAEGKTNIWGMVPAVMEMQSEAGAAGTIHGALQTGSLATTFTASQGLLLMIPNMYKIAGELTPTVFHVAARSLAAQALSIFGDHSDVMAARATGFAMLCSASVQEAMDFALIAHAATLKSRIPFLHFFDGFRTSHEVSKIHMLSADDIRQMIDEDLVRAHRERGLSPDRPVLRGTAQNPDVYFQARETVNPFYDACPQIVQDAMDKFAKMTGRQYGLFEYHGAPDATRVIVIMGSGCETVFETADTLNAQKEKVGVVKVRLYRPFDVRRFIEILPATVKTIAVLDRTKEPGSLGEPLYLDCLKALVEGLANGWGKLKSLPNVVGGRYGLSSKEFTPAMVKGIYDHLATAKPKNSFTIGINDDVSHTSLPYDHTFSIEKDDVYRALFYGLGSDGTVSANKNSIKIIGEKTENYVQGYFVYDSKKAGAVTVSHLRFGPKPIHAPYLVSRSNFVACHQWTFIDRYHMLGSLIHGGTFLLNSPYGPDKVWAELPMSVQKQIIEKKIKLYVIDAYQVARECGIGSYINTVMQVCFFSLIKILPSDQTLAEIKKAIEKTYKAKGEETVKMNLKVVDQTLARLHEVTVPAQPKATHDMIPPVPAEAPEFVTDVLGVMIEGRGDELPVSALPIDGTYPTGTSHWEKRNLAQAIPVWESEICIQCGKCAIVCPHAAIRAKAYEPSSLKTAPPTFKSVDARAPEWAGLKYTIQTAVDYCTGCRICVEVCPAKSKTDATVKAINMKPEPPLRAPESKNFDFFMSIPDLDRRKINVTRVRQQQVQQPLFEFSSACAGCGETPYIKLMSQLFGDRSIVANATGCSSIYGGNLPTTPWTKDAQGRGPAWSNSLFEDNAEFGLGIRLSVDKQKDYATELLKKLSGNVGADLVDGLVNAKQKDEADIYDQRQRVGLLKAKLRNINTPEAKTLLGLADMLVKKSVWIIGGDGWAYDIGFGGLDHVFATGENVNILVLDTEVYSNTGGQASKATPTAAAAKFATNGKLTGKKDLGLMAMTYGNVYVANVALGANDEHTLKAFIEAEAYDGPSLIIAYSHCIAHGINMSTAMQNQKALVRSGRWPLYRYNPELRLRGENPFCLEKVSQKIPLEQYMNMESRFNRLIKTRPEETKLLWQQSQKDVDYRTALYEHLASVFEPLKEEPAAPSLTGKEGTGK